MSQASRYSPQRASDGTHLPQELLQSVLTDSLSESDESSVSRHLSDCEECRQQLESLAATKDVWARASLLSGLKSPCAADDSEAEDETFDVDFAVQFLEPANGPDSIGRLGDIDIQEVIGRGAMGVVLKGWQKELNRFVAVKVMSPYLAVNGAARRRFEREAQAAAAILHPNVMPIHSVKSTGRLPYLVMPYLVCESLQERLDREGGLPLTELLRIAIQIAKGLAAAHAQGLVHRDVKPANILLERDVDRVMLTDFGLARAVDDASLTRSGMIAGTPQYMSPEQASGDALDQRSDLFSFGSVLYAMAAGRPPFRAESSYGILRRVGDADMRPLQEIHPEIPEWLGRLVARLHARNREDRISSAAEVADLLEQCLAHVRQPAANPLPASLKQVMKLSGSRRWLVSFGLGVVPVGLLAASVLSSGPQELPNETPIPGMPVEEGTILRESISDLPPVSAPGTDDWDDGIDARLRLIGIQVRALEKDDL